MKKFFFLMMGLVAAANAFAATPADPTNVDWYDCESESGFSRLMYQLPQVDTEGNPLNLENLGYRVYTDNDQLFTFEASDYTFDLNFDTSEIFYWLFSDAVDFRPTYTYFYRTNATGYDQFFTWRIGIQVIYINEDNSRTYSNIVYKEVFDAPVQPENLGDVDGDGQVGISDVTALIDYLLSGNDNGIVLDNADIDGDGNIGIADVTALIDKLLAGN